MPQVVAAPTLVETNIHDLAAPNDHQDTRRAVITCMTPQVIGAPTLFATHFHELTGLTGEGGVCNMHVQTAIDKASGKLTMLYQVSSTICLCICICQYMRENMGLSIILVCWNRLTLEPYTPPKALAHAIAEPSAMSRPGLRTEV